MSTVPQAPVEAAEQFAPWSSNQRVIYDAMMRAVDGTAPCFVLAGMRAGKTEAMRAAVADAEHVIVVAPTRKIAENSGIVGRKTLFCGAGVHWLRRENEEQLVARIQQSDPVFVFEHALWIPGIAEVTERVLAHTNRVIALSSRSTPDLVTERWSLRFATWDVNPNLPYDTPRFEREYATSPVGFARDYGLEDSREPAALAKYPITWETTTP